MNTYADKVDCYLSIITLSAFFFLTLSVSPPQCKRLF